MHNCKAYKTTKKNSNETKSWNEVINTFYRLEKGIVWSSRNIANGIIWGAEVDNIYINLWSREKGVENWRTENLETIAKQRRVQFGFITFYFVGETFKLVYETTQFTLVFHELLLHIKETDLRSETILQ